MSGDLIDYEQAYNELEREYTRLKHAYDKLRRDHEHARAAIENDLLIADLAARLDDF